MVSAEAGGSIDHSDECSRVHLFYDVREGSIPETVPGLNGVGATGHKKFLRCRQLRRPKRTTDADRGRGGPAFRRDAMEKIGADQRKHD